MKKAAIIPAQGVGDSLLLLIGAHTLRLQGFAVTFYDVRIQELKSWLPPYTFCAKMSSAPLEELQTFDLIILQHDNTPLAKELLTLRENNKLPSLVSFYPSYKTGKHPHLSPRDYVCSSAIPIAENIAIFTSQLLNIEKISKDNGLSPPSHLIRSKEPMKVLLHPGSSHEDKNWPLKCYLHLAKALEKKGFTIAIPLSSSKEKKLIPSRWQLLTPTLADLAKAIYEAGYVIGNDSLACHLASNLNIPSLVIADCKKRMALWQPGWHPASTAFPHPLLLKFFSLFKKKTAWKKSISVKNVLNKFIQITLKNNSL
jgi:heptosyltransferase-3